MDEGQPRPRLPFRAGAVSIGDVRSPALIDYPFGLVLDRGYLRVWVGKDGLTPATRNVIADLLDQEAARLRDEANRVIAYTNRLPRGGTFGDAPSHPPVEAPRASGE